jgi:ubiquinone/menaquinone biosynthesis C-methylase UbiE
MSFYNTFVYPQVTKFMNHYVGSHPVTMKLMLELFDDAQGDVLEIGIGPGESLKHYDPSKVSKVYGLDPFDKFIDAAGRIASQVDIDVTLLKEGAENISLDDNSIDTIFSTFTFCTIPDLSGALAEMRRVLKPGGRMLFWEHGLSDDPKVARTQYRIAPLHCWMFNGCHATREITKEISGSGFNIVDMQSLYIHRIPKSWGNSWIGKAEISGS